MVSNVTVWKGEEADLYSLNAAVMRNCCCSVADVENPNPPKKCPAHEMLSDQHVMDHLAFAVSMRELLTWQEWNVKK